MRLWLSWADEAHAFAYLSVRHFTIAARAVNGACSQCACGCLGPTKPTHSLTSLSVLSPLPHAQLTERVANALVVVLGDDDQSYISTAEVEERSKAYSVALMTALHVSGWRVCLRVCACVGGWALVWAGWRAGLLGRSHDRTPREWLACVCLCRCSVLCRY
jgi:hypothetical protein